MINETPITVERVREFKQVRTPDYAKLSRLITIAKGNERSMAQFAEETGIGASTLSRIINLNIKKPLSIDNIISIFECRADKTDEFLLDSLARANGYYPQEDAERMLQRESFSFRRNEMMNRRNMMKNGIIAGIVSAGIPIKEVFNEPIDREALQRSSLYPSRHGDFVVGIQPELNASNIHVWSFHLFPQLIEEYMGRPINPRMEIHRIFERINRWFIIDAWDSEYLRGLKLSFAFIDETLFNEFKDAIRIAKIHNEMTLLLLNPTTYSVVSEVWIPGEYEQFTNISVFQAAMPNSDFMYDDEENDENMEDFE